MVRDLRARCPWDRAQTRETLRPYLVEEVLELDHAIGHGDAVDIRGELGDVLLNLAFWSFANAQVTGVNAGYSAVSATQKPAWVGKDAGMFAKNGFDVQLFFFNGGSTAMLE